ncbi:MAG TPA: LysM peptidoglycan-binding domain-containing protein [Nocardioides sp.]|nr:LysM peptidoglycan-binding domain-containing protein [Nocardioides sp.]
MSTVTATRTPRLTPPIAPTRKATPRRRTVGQGASVVGLADRPVLRIVADDERAPIVTRVRPVGPPPSVEPHPSVEPVETTVRRIDLTEFFAAEYDGDDQAVEVVRPRPSSLRLTRRGRLVVFGASIVAALGLGFVAASGSLANDHPEPTRVVTVQPGQTLWDIAAQASDGGDVRATMSHLEALNHLDSTTLQVGQTLRVPK